MYYIFLCSCTAYNTKLQWRNKCTGVQEIIFHFRLSSKAAVYSADEENNPSGTLQHERRTMYRHTNMKQNCVYPPSRQTMVSAAAIIIIILLVPSICVSTEYTVLNIYSDNTPQCRTIYRCSFIIFRSYIYPPVLCVFNIICARMCTCE